MIQKIVVDTVLEAIKKFLPGEQELGQQVAGEVEARLKQLDINLADAKSENWIQSAWRPALAWYCIATLVYKDLLEPAARFAATTVFQYSGTFPVVDDTNAKYYLGILLGLGTLRTIDKVAKLFGK
jgi:hypothetical protein